MGFYISIDARTQLFRSHFSRAARTVRGIVLAANQVCSMKKAVTLLNVLFALVGVGLAQNHAASQSSQPAPATTQTMKVDDVRPGMKGVGYTVFQGTKPETMGVEVLGVLHNMNGPKSDVVLVRLLGNKAEFTGVVAGMSGSPVYIDGKLLGAIAYRIGQFSKAPIAGVTPIEQMLEINEFDQSIPQSGAAAVARVSAVSRTSTPGAADSNPIQSYAQYLTPIDAPFVFNGFSEEAIKQFAPNLAAAGITPVMGVGSASKEKQPEPLAPGSAVSAIMVRGDMDVAATCTVTYMDKDHLLACGHPLMQFGMVDMPMTKANVVATLSSPLNAFKIINTTEAVGAFVQDRHTGILGRFDRDPKMIPVTLSIHGLSGPREYHYEVLNNAKLTPVMMMTTVYNALMGMNQYGEETTYRMNGRIHVNGFSDVRLTNMFSPVDATTPAYAVAMSLGDHFGRIYDNPFEAPTVSGVNLEFDLEPERRAAVLESARTDVTEARPGDEITIEAVLRP